MTAGSDSGVFRPSRPLTVAQVAHRLGCTAKYVRTLLGRGRIRGFRLEREWRVSPEAVVEYQTRNRCD